MSSESQLSTVQAEYFNLQNENEIIKKHLANYQNQTQQLHG